MADTTKRRWYRLTPDRLILVLLAVEGFLLLAEQFGWFPKGYAVLTTVAAVGLALFFMLLWFVVALVFRWRFQYGIRSLLVLVVVVAIPSGWLAAEMRAAKRQKEAVEAFKAYSPMPGLEVVQIRYDSDPNSGFPAGQSSAKTWLREWFGRDYTDDVVEAFYSYGYAPVMPAYVGEDQNPERARQCDAILVLIGRLWSLKAIYLCWTHTTDTGLTNIRGLTGLRELYLDGTCVTDRGVEHLIRFTALETLQIGCTRITDVGLGHLKPLVALKSLGLGRTNITDTGLEHLQGFTHLQHLDIRGTKVTDAGVKKLQQALPNCEIRQ